MDKWIKVRNTQNVFIPEFPSFQIPYFLEDQSLIRKNKSLIRKERFCSYKNGDPFRKKKKKKKKGFSKPPSINQEDPYDEKICNPNYKNCFFFLFVFLLT